MVTFSRFQFTMYFTLGLIATCPILEDFPGEWMNFIVSKNSSNIRNNSIGKEFACNVGDSGLAPGSGRFPWRRKWQPSLVFLPGKFHGQRSLAGYCLLGCKSWIQLSN